MAGTIRKIDRDISTDSLVDHSFVMSSPRVHALKTRFNVMRDREFFHFGTRTYGEINVVREYIDSDSRIVFTKLLRSAYFLRECPDKTCNQRLKYALSMGWENILADTLEWLK